MPSNTKDLSPTIYNQKSFLSKAFDRFVCSNKTNKILSTLKKNKEYDVLTADAFKYLVDKKTDTNTIGTLLMADINDLYKVNSFYNDKSVVNSMIKELIDGMKNIVESSEIKNYDFGKMGDELFIYIPNHTKCELENVLSEISALSSGPLTICVGSCDDFKEGFDTCLKKAEVDLSFNKKVFKDNRLLKTCGENVPKLVSKITESQIEKMRISLKSLKDSSKFTLKDNFSKALELIDFKTLHRKPSQKNIDNSEKNQYSKENILDSYKNEALAIYGPNASEKVVEKYVLSQILSRKPGSGVVQNEYFQSIGYSEYFKNAKASKKDDLEVLYTGLSGLKKVNDSLGYEKGDDAIYNSYSYVKSTLEALGITTYSDVIAKGSGDSFIITDHITEEKKGDLSKRFSNFKNFSNMSHGVSLIPISKSIDKESLQNEKSFKSAINSSLLEFDKMLEEICIPQKISDIEHMKVAIENIYLQALELSETQGFSKEDISLTIQTAFKNLLYRENEDLIPFEHSKDEKAKEKETNKEK